MDFRADGTDGTEVHISPKLLATLQLKLLGGGPTVIRSMPLPVNPPILLMLSKRIAEIPAGGAWIFEPKWDGLRTLVFRDGDEILVQSRDEKSLNRYFPELLITLRGPLGTGAGPT
jgi:ATP-dependent DNA ligase